LTALAVTAYAMQGDPENILNAGFDGYLPKPINSHDLANEIERLLHKREDQNAVSNHSSEGNASKQTRPAINWPIAVLGRHSLALLGAVFLSDMVSRIPEESRFATPTEAPNKESMRYANGRSAPQVPPGVNVSSTEKISKKSEWP
jgi:hypothetical protein